MIAVASWAAVAGHATTAASTGPGEDSRARCEVAVAAAAEVTEAVTAQKVTEVAEVVGANLGGTRTMAERETMTATAEARSPLPSRSPLRPLLPRLLHPPRLLLLMMVRHLCKEITVADG
jgi:hypothetical protein